MATDPARPDWVEIVHTAATRVEELHYHRPGGACGFLWRVTDDLSGESVTLSAEQWATVTRAWADAPGLCAGAYSDTPG